MAYDAGYYEPPQRGYNNARGPPGPTPGQPYPPARGYSQDPYGGNQYAQDEYYNNGYAQDYGGQYQQQPQHQQPPPQQMNGGYPQQQQQGGYGNFGNGGRPPGPPMGPSQGRGAPYQRPPTADGVRGGGYPPRGRGGPGMARDGRPPPIDRAASVEPGAVRRKAPIPSPTSPQGISWDNPFPAFPNAKKKPNGGSADPRLAQMMDNMGLNENGAAQPKQPKASPPMSHGRPSIESQRNGGNGYPNPGYGGPQDQRRPLPPQGPPGGYGNQGDMGYSQEPQGSFGPTRSNTMPADFNNPPSNRSYPPRYASQQQQPQQPHQVQQPPSQGPPPQQFDFGPSAPYNGPVGRNMPPRPSTATGTRPPPQRRPYPPAPAPVINGPPSSMTQAPQEQQYSEQDPSYLGVQGRSSLDQGYSRNPRVSEFYDAYYELPSARNRKQEPEEMPNFDAMNSNTAQPGRGRGMSIEQHIQAGSGLPLQQTNSGRPSIEQGNGYVNRTKSQPDLRAQAQPQAAIFEMANDVPPLPNNSMGGGVPMPNGYGQYNNQGPPPGPTPGPLQQRGFNGMPANGGVPRSNTMPMGPPPTDALPAHPTPVRPGQIPNSVAAQAQNRPTPVRNYDAVNQVVPIATAPPQPRSAPQTTGLAPVTHAELEQLRITVKNNPNDQVSAMMLARRLIEACDVLVPAMPDQKQRNKARERFVLDAHKILKKLVQQQNPEAMFFLADSYGRGSLGLEADNKEAFQLYQSAAKLGHAAAAYRTAVCCELGQEEGGGTRKDPLKAIQWYKRAATLGDVPGMYKMGMIMLKGLLGQQRNPREAVGWLKRAAEQADAENPHALHELGLLYESAQPNDNIIRDEPYALQLFTQAADLGYKFSQFRLGCAYEYGLLGCQVDARTSIMWYSRAAVQEEHQSELALSGWYLTGSEGVLQQSDTEAYLWARKAAYAGLAKAEYAMGYFTEVGIGTERDIEGAKRWYWRAAAQNFPKARERLEDLKRGGNKSQLKNRERYSRSKVGKQNEGECSLM